MQHNLLAQSLSLPGDGSIDGPIKTSLGGNSMTIGSVLSGAIPYIFVFAGAGLFIMLLASGFTFLTSAGDPKKLAQAQGQLTNALIGFLIIFASFWAVQAAGIIFGLDSITSVFQ
jgi:hypothetical protein